MLLILALHARADDTLVYSEDFNFSTDGSFSGTDGWQTGYSSDPWSTFATFGIVAKTDDEGGSWGTGSAIDNHLVQTSYTWTDFTLRVGTYSADDDTLGVVFRYVDSQNFYLFFANGGGASPGTGSGGDGSVDGNALYVISGGNATLLASSSARYTAYATCAMQVVASDDHIEVWFDSDADGSFASTELVADVYDATIPTGSIGLYSYNNGSGAGGSVFDNVEVYRHDRDGDTVYDDEDNCPDDPNLDQADADGDNIGDVCDEDADGDGWRVAAGDCDDTDRDVNPDATERCDTPADDDCDGSTNDEGAKGCVERFLDADGDTYGDVDSLCTCDAVDAYTAAKSDDCDDSDASIHPDAVELCDGVDQDCDGHIDEDAVDLLTWYLDTDADGYGVDTDTVESCPAVEGYAAVDGDCDDGDAAVNPEEVEVCDGVDQDCDGQVDEEAADATLWYGDIDMDGYAGEADVVAACTAPSGYSDTPTDCDDADAAISPGALESCLTEYDDDCDGDTNDEDALSCLYWYPDGDADGFGGLDGACLCSATKDYALGEAKDCDDADATVNPDGVEVCDGIDQDCDGLVDDGATDLRIWYKDADDDGFGDTSIATESCSPPEGSVEEPGDCDDADAGVYPGAPETCDDRDEDCDGEIDEDATDPLSWYADTDADGFGGDELLVISCDGPDGAVTNSDDCDDLADAIFPGADEYCNGVDDDCDGEIDAPDPVDGTTWFFDHDGDGYGDEASGITTCEPPEGMTEVGGDCDDAEAGVNPGAEETVDRVDNDCDGRIDEGFDTDGDGLDDDVELGDTLTDPDNPDTDGGGVDDGTEVANGTDPLDPGDDGGGSEDTGDTGSGGGGGGDTAEIEREGGFHGGACATTGGGAGLGLALAGLLALRRRR